MTTEVRIDYKCADEYGEIYEDSESVTCSVESEDRGEYWGVPCSEDIVNIEPAEERAREIVEEVRAYGGKVFEITIDGEDVVGVELDEPDASDLADEADFRRDEARDEEAIRQLSEVG